MHSVIMFKQPTIILLLIGAAFAQYPLGNMDKNQNENANVNNNQNSLAGIGVQGRYPPYPSGPVGIPPPTGGPTFGAPTFAAPPIGAPPMPNYPIGPQMIGGAPVIYPDDHMPFPTENPFWYQGGGKLRICSY